MNEPSVMKISVADLRRARPACCGRVKGRQALEKEKKKKIRSKKQETNLCNILFEL